MLDVIVALAPLLLLLACLLAGHYPGLKTIVRLAERFADRLRLRVGKGQAVPVSPDRRSASGGLLIALALAQRPPPLAA